MTLKSLCLGVVLASVNSVCFAAGPVANADQRSMPKNTVINIDVIRNDTSPDGNSLLILSVSNPAHGSAVLNEDGSVTYTPAQNYVGQDSFSYQLIENVEGGQTVNGQVTITVTPGTLQSLAQTPNSRSLGQALDDVCQELAASQAVLSIGSNQLLTRCGELSAVSVSHPEDIEAILRQIAPEETLALLKVASSAGQAQSDTLSQYTANLGRGIQSISSRGLSWSSNPELGGAAGDDLAAKLGFFSSVQFGQAKKKFSANENGFDFNNYALLAGVDYALTQDWVAGVALGYGQNELEYTHADGTVDTDSFSVFGFSHFQWENFGLDGQLGSSASNFDVRRNIQLKSLSENASSLAWGATNGQQYLAKLQVTYDFNLGGLRLTPNAGVFYSAAQIDAYSENNANGFEVRLQEQTFDQLQLELGLQGQYVINFANFVMTPGFDITAISDNSSEPDPAQGEFTYALSSHPFQLAPEAVDSSYFDAGAQVGFLFPGGASAFAKYSQFISNQVLQSNRFELGARLEF